MSTMNWSGRQLRFLLVAALVATSGCSGCNKPPGADESTPQGRRLGEMFRAGRTPKPEAVGDLPLVFDPIRIQQREGRGQSHFYEAELVWSVKEDASLGAWLVNRVKTSGTRVQPGKVADFTLQVSYSSEAGDAVDTEEIKVPLDNTTTSVVLPQFAANDKPAGVKVAVRSVEWLEPGGTAKFTQQASAEATAENGKIALKIPANLPVRFEDVNVNAADPSATFPPRARWSLAVKDQATLKSRLEPLIERKPQIDTHALKGLVMRLTTKDRKGQPIHVDDAVTLDLSGTQGSLQLPSIQKGDAVQSAVLELVAVTFVDRKQTVKLER
jgi:hypothetical protein